MRRKSHLAIASLAAALGCGTDATSTEPRISRLEVVQPPPSVALPGLPLYDSVAVRVVDEGGKPRAGVEVRWLSKTLRATVSPATTTTDDSGRVAVEWVFGPTEGVQQLEARLANDSTLLLQSEATYFRADRLSASYTGGCAVRSGDIWCWGAQGVHPLTSSRNVSRFVVGSFPLADVRPVRITRGESFVDVRNTGLYACGLRSNGTVACFSGAFAGYPETLVPITVPALRSLSASGWFSTCGLAVSDSTPWCWDERLQPATRVPGAPPLLDLAGIYNPVGWNVSGCGRQVDSTPWCWGMQAPSVPGDTLRFLQMGVSNEGGCGVRPSLEAWCWRNGVMQTVATRAAENVTSVSVNDDIVLGVRLGRVIRWDLNTQRSWSMTPVTSIANALVSSLMPELSYCVRLSDGAVHCGGEHFSNESGYYNDQFWPLQPVDP